MVQLEESLHRFFLSAFTNDALRRFLAHHDSTEGIAVLLPGGTASAAQVSSAAAELLAQQGLIDLRFVQRLVARYPYRVTDIVAVLGSAIAPHLRRESPSTLSRRLIPSGVLEHLTACFNQPTARVVLGGESRSGKTTIASHFVGTRPDDWTTAWFDVGLQGVAAAVSESIAATLDIAAPTGVDADRLVSAFCRSLRLVQGPVLLTLDDVWEVEDAVAYLSEHDGDAISLLMTSQNGKAEGATRLVVPMPAVDTARAYLGDPTLADADVAALVEQMGTMPEVLVAVRKSLEPGMQTPAFILRQYEAKGYEAVGIRPMEPFDRRADRILANDELGSMRRLLGLLGSVQDAPAPLELVAIALGSTGDAPALIADLERLVQERVLRPGQRTDGRRVRVACDSLVRRWLVSRNERWTPGRLADALGRYLEDLHDVRGLPHVLAGWTPHLVGAARGVQGDPERHGWWTRLRTIQLLLEAGRIDDAQALLPDEFPEPLDDHYRFLKAQILNREWKCLGDALAIYEALSGGVLYDDRNWGGELAYQWGKALQRVGQFLQAKEQFRRALQFWREDKTHAAMAAQSLGRVLSRLDQHDEAFRCFEQALAASELHHPHHARALYGFGLAMERAGFLEDAHVKLREGAGAHDRALGEDRHHSLATHFEHERVGARLGQDGAQTRAATLLERLESDPTAHRRSRKRFRARFRSIPGAPPADEDLGLAE